MIQKDSFNKKLVIGSVIVYTSIETGMEMKQAKVLDRDESDETLAVELKDGSVEFIRTNSSIYSICKIR